MALLDIFVGAPQSKYAAIAILVALGVVSLAMLFGKDEVPIGQKFLFVLLMLVIALPSVLLSLFQLTCLVTGAGYKNQRWWCGAYAWIGTIFVMIYSAIVVVVGIIAMTNGTTVSTEMENLGMFETMKVEADKQAKEYFQNMTEEEKKDAIIAQSQPDKNMQIPKLPTPPVDEPAQTAVEPFVDASQPMKKEVAPVAAPAPGTEHFADFQAF